MFKRNKLVSNVLVDISNSNSVFTCHRRHLQATAIATQCLMPSMAGSCNETLNENTSVSGVLYYGVHGFGITWTFFIMNIVLLIVAGTGLVLNIIALKIVAVNSPVREVSNNLVSHLARSDIFIGIICIYNVLYNLIHYKNYYECALRTGLATCIALNSSIHLLFLSFDRYFKIIHPFKYIKYFSNENRLKMFSWGIWMVTGILGLLPILGWRRPPVHGTKYCSYFGVLDKCYLTLMSGLFYGINIIMLYCYISIICVAWKQRGKDFQSGKVKQNTVCRRSSKAQWWAPTRTVLILITLYSCCWMPTAVVISLHLLDVFPPSYTDDKKGVIVAYATACVYLNIVANPLIYAIKFRRVRHTVRSVVSSFTGSILSDARHSRQSSLTTDTRL